MDTLRSREKGLYSHRANAVCASLASRALERVHA
jgi:hypothetical protein